jgi:hypothetical protein
MLYKYALKTTKKAKKKKEKRNEVKILLNVLYYFMK